MPKLTPEVGRARLVDRGFSCGSGVWQWSSRSGVTLRSGGEAPQRSPSAPTLAMVRHRSVFLEGLKRGWSDSAERERPDAAPAPECRAAPTEVMTILAGCEREPGAPDSDAPRSVHHAQRTAMRLRSAADGASARRRPGRRPCNPGPRRPAASESRRFGRRQAAGRVIWSRRRRGPKTACPSDCAEPSRQFVASERRRAGYGPDSPSRSAPGWRPTPRP